MIKLKKNFLVVATFIAAIAIIFLSQISSDNFRIKILNIFRVPFKLCSGLFYTLRDISEFNELKVENSILKENTANINRKLLELEEARLENKRLKTLLEFKEANSRKFIPCLVIARDPFELRHTIIIDKGRRHNIAKDMIVVSGNGLVGRVRETGWSIARVLLITDYDSVFSGIVQRTRDEGAVMGNMQEGLIMKYLDLSSDVQKGDKVITSGFYGGVEKGVLIGEVVSVEKDPSGLYLSAVIKPEVDVMRIEEVLVMR